MRMLVHVIIETKADQIHCGVTCKFLEVSLERCTLFHEDLDSSEPNTTEKYKRCNECLTKSLPMYEG